MKYAIALLITIIGMLSTGSAFSMQEFLYPYKVYPSGTVILHDRMKGVYIIKPKAWDFVFDSDGTNASDLLTETPGATAVINASYFGYSGSLFIPAGIYAPDPSPIDQTHCERDKNICQLLDLETLSFSGYVDIVKTPTVSAGPVLLQKGTIPDELSTRYSHRQSKSYRTVLLHTKRGPLFVVTKKQYTLPKLARYIQNLFGTVSAVNLDGGGSTALATTSSETFQRNQKKRLPTFFVLY